MEHPLQQLLRHFVSAASAPIGEGSTRNAAAALTRLEESQREESEVLAALARPRPRIRRHHQATA